MPIKEIMNAHALSLFTALIHDRSDACLGQFV
jgi:hypothetical protein